MRRLPSAVRLLATILMINVIFFAGAAKAATETGGATPAVKAVLDRAMEIQTKPELQGDEHRKDRAKLVRQLISESFLSEEMARESIGEHWEKLSGKQRSEFTGIFAGLFQDSYTRMVLNFLQKETIEYRAESPASGGTQVRTVIMRANEHIPVDYRLERKNNKWLIRDVDIDGVSILETYRNSFRKEIRTGSFESLLKKMRIQRQAAGDDKA